MSNTTKQDLLSAQLYSRAMSAGENEFRSWALEFLEGEIPYLGAIWRRLTAADRRVYGVSSVKLPPSFSSAWDRNKREDQLADAIAENPNTAQRVSKSDDPDTLFQSPLYLGLYKDLEIEHSMGIEYSTRPGAPINEILLFRTATPGPFSIDEADLFRSFAYHATEASACALFVNLARPQAQHWQHASALCDASGRLYEVQGRFLELTGKHFPDWNGQELPFAIRRADYGKIQREGALRIYTSESADLTLVRVWESSAMDVLSAQERSIVLAVCQGKTYKAIAQDMGLASSTVSTHVYSACAKMGVRGKNALIDAIGADAGMASDAPG